MGEEADIAEIENKYVPFLKKLIAFVEKKKDPPDNLSRLKLIYDVFTTADTKKQLEVFHANKKKLEKWISSAQKDDAPAATTTPAPTKRALVVEDSDSSQGGASDSQTAKRRKDAIEPKTAVVNPMKTIKQEPLQNKTLAPPTAAPTPEVSNGSRNSTPPASEPEDPNAPLTFTCASCQFQTQDDQEFMKHTRTDHRSDLSMWCKHCGKCFSNAGVLVTHIKERNCVKEDMLYRCGVKECTFQTGSGQTFVHHLRHCHKGSPFIFCVHCQKIFTLPHCLILHMQDDCPFKDKNRRNPGSAPLVETPVTRPPYIPPVVRPVAPVVRPPTITPVQRGALTPRSGALAPRPVAPVPSPRGGRGRGRGRGGRGRGRGRGRGYESSPSDSDDPDDPVWCPEEPPQNTNLRRSGRWAKKVSDVENVVDSARKKSISAELQSKSMFQCPCCDFMASFKSVLTDHYIAAHKIASKNACDVCKLKFESREGFIDHFEDHASGKLANATTNEDAKQSTTSKNAVNNAQSVVTVEEDNSNSPAPSPIVVSPSEYKDVVKPITTAGSALPEKSDFVKIPYQASIHANRSQMRFKKFDDLKAPDDLVAMKTEANMRCFFKCPIYNCSFTSNDHVDYKTHLEKQHKVQRKHCVYCFKDYTGSEDLITHMISEHSSRNYQCSHCFYRAYSKMHVKIHIKNVHQKETTTPEIYACEKINIPSHIKVAVRESDANGYIYPYLCAIGNCGFQTLEPKEFKRHNETEHRSVSLFFCHYCKVDFISLKKMMEHYRLHGISVYQCSYCINGCETHDDIMHHLCNVHPDESLICVIRGNEEDLSSELAPFVTQVAAPEAKSTKPDQTVPEVQKDTAAEAPESNEEFDTQRSSYECDLYEVVGETYFPKYLRKMCSDIVCGVSFCKERMETVESYVAHLRHVHAARNFPCLHCPHMSETWEDFRNHLKCHGPNLFACGMLTCDFYNWNKNTVTMHLKSHEHNTAKVVIIREEDEKDCELEKVKLLPQSLPYNIPEESYQCFFCNYKSSDRKTMKNHMYQELAYKRFSCDLCSATFVSRSEIPNHFASLHADAEVKVTETQNPKVLNAVDKVLQAGGEWSEIQSKQCSLCSKNFKYFIQWQRHLQLCANNHYQPFDCSFCSKSCPDLTLMKYHVDDSHFPQDMKYLEVGSPEVEADIGKNLQLHRLKCLNLVIDKLKSMKEEKEEASKVYICSVCSFKSNHKYNVQQHIKNAKKCASGDIIKDKHEIKVENEKKIDTNKNVKSDDNKVEPVVQDDVKRYRCMYCIKKIHTLDELDSHVEASHVLKNENKYHYYYTPNLQSKSTLEDKERYECAYCKSGKDSLANLKKHSDLMHTEMQFKVKGTVVRSQEELAISACGYCYLRVGNASELKRHIASFHSNMPHKSIGGFDSASTKRQADEDEDIPNKRVKFGDTVFACGHCGNAFSTHELVATHCKRAHSRLAPDIRKMSQSLDTDFNSLRFYKCEFCQFTSEKQHLEPHLAAKHKMRVSCAHCDKRFEFATMAREHHEMAHKGLPLKYSQETVLTIKKEPEDTPIKKEPEPKKAAVKASKTKGGKKRHLPDPIQKLALGKIMISVRGPDKKFIKMSVLNYSKKVNIFPSVTIPKLDK